MKLGVKQLRWFNNLIQKQTTTQPNHNNSMNEITPRLLKEIIETIPESEMDNPIKHKGGFLKDGVRRQSKDNFTNVVFDTDSHCKGCGEKHRLFLNFITDHPDY